MNQDHLLADITALTADGGRNVGSTGHARARQYIVERLIELSLIPYAKDSFVLPYGPEDADFANIVAMVSGTSPDLPHLLLGAHFDTCGNIPGADDNAAAVAILLNVAERLRDQRRDRTLVFAFFDAEEPPNFLQETMGSIRFYEDQRTDPIHVAIILDLVGHDVRVPGIEDLLFITGSETDPVLDRIVRNAEPESGIRTVPTLNEYVGDLSDHHVFRKNECPYLFLTCGHWEHYHAVTDTPEKLNTEKIRSVAGYVQTLAETLSDSNLDGPFNGNDTIATEIYFLEKNILPTLGGLGIAPPLQTRSDISRLVTLLINRFGL